MISQYRKGTGINMINFEEELKNFKPSLEVEEAEQAIYNHELTDMTAGNAAGIKAAEQITGRSHAQWHDR